MLTYIITRFSIYDFNFKGFELTKNKNSDEQEEYKKKLFSEDRLNYKFNSFEKITLPSVVNQTNKNFIWYIYASIYLPDVYKKRLLDITEKYTNIKCIFIKSFDEFNKIEYINSKYCTMRLDDDDGLSVKFIESINQYKNLDKVIISHPHGVKFTLQNNYVIYGNKIFIKKIALGLCAIGMNIYECGDHTKVDKKFKVLYDIKPRMYIMNCSEFCDSQRKL